MVSYTKTKEEVINELALSWNKSGLNQGDIVLVHSALSRFLKKFKEKGIYLTPSDILDSFIKTVGEKGTLLFPTYTFEFTKGITFDIRNTKSQMGALSESARNHPLSIRTGHPVHSFAALGYHKDLFKGLYNYSSFGSDSPLGKLFELEGKIALLDIPGEMSNSFYHYVEEMENVPYRYHKSFMGPYIDYDGVERIREFGFFVRNLEQKVLPINIKPMEDYLKSINFYSGDRPGEGTCLSVIKARTLYDQVAKIIREGRTLEMLYTSREDN